MNYVSAYPRELLQRRKGGEPSSPPFTRLDCPFCPTVVLGEYYATALWLLDHIKEGHRHD